MKTGISWALMAIVISLCTQLGAMFSAPGIVHFADIPPVAYGNAIVGAVLAGATTYLARMKESPT